MAAVDAAQIGCSAICISLDPTKKSVGEFSDEQDLWEWNEETFNCRVVDHALLFKKRKSALLFKKSHH